MVTAEGLVVREGTRLEAQDSHGDWLPSVVRGIDTNDDSAWTSGPKRRGSSQATPARRKLSRTAEPAAAKVRSSATIAAGTSPKDEAKCRAASCRAPGSTIRDRVSRAARRARSSIASSSAGGAGLMRPIGSRQRGVFA